VGEEQSLPTGSGVPATQQRLAAISGVAYSTRCQYAQAQGQMYLDAAATVTDVNTAIKTVAAETGSGLSTELIPHMLGATRLPLGVRGLYCYWRTGARVIAPNAFRYLKVK
jgi:hypothetical protein